MEKIDWRKFEDDYRSVNDEEKIQMLIKHLKHFDTCPSWAEARVWGMALRA